MRESKRYGNKDSVSKLKLFGDLNIKYLNQDKEFKEDSVREVIIIPILKALGYSQKNIVRSKTLQHPFLKIGSNKKIPIKLIPDYSIKVEENFAWVLDAKSPSEDKSCPEIVDKN